MNKKRWKQFPVLVKAYFISLSTRRGQINLNQSWLTQAILILLCMFIWPSSIWGVCQSHLLNAWRTGFFMEQKVFSKKNPILDLYLDCCNLLIYCVKPALFGNPIVSLCKLHKVFQGWETCFPSYTPRPLNTNSSPRTCVVLGFLQPRHLQHLPSWWSLRGVSLLSQTENCTQMLETSFSLKREAKESIFFKE